MYYSGTWQFPQFVKTIGDNFDWYAVPNPCGPAAACTGMPGGAALVAYQDHQEPRRKSRCILDYLASEPVYAEYHARTLFLSGAAQALRPRAITYKSDLKQVQTSRSHTAVARSRQDKLSPIAFAYQGFEHNRIMFNATIARLNQAISGEMSLDDALGAHDHATSPRA